MLLALAIVAACVVPLAGSYASGTLAVQQSVNVTRAAHLAAGQLDRLRARPFTELAALPARQPLDAAGLPRPFEGEVERADLAPGELLRLTVRLRWHPTEKLTEKVELSTFVLNPRTR
jgi:hypothetical protein